MCRLSRYPAAAPMKVSTMVRSTASGSGHDAALLST